MAEVEKIVPFSDSNLAYDLRDFEERTMKRHRKTAQKTNIKKNSVQSKPLAMPHLSIMSILCFLLIVALAFGIVYSYMQLNEIAASNSHLTAQISTLQTEEEKLNTQVEQKITLEELEEKAKALGMIEPAGSQIQYFDMSGEDHGEVIDNSSSSIWASITDTIAEFFGAE